jgi:hypothetical protein
VSTEPGTGHQWHYLPGHRAVRAIAETHQKAARAEAFLSVPLYRRVYDEFKGKQLPPRLHGLQQAFAKFGVSSKQTRNARLAFDKSATQAGFFSAGPDRLIEPIIGGAISPIGPTGPGSSGPSQVRLHAASLSVGESGAVLGLDPLIQGLLRRLPSQAKHGKRTNVQDGSKRSQPTLIWFIRRTKTIKS